MSTISRVGIDPRGPRFGALMTTILLVVTIVTGSPIALGLQVVLFALGTFLGVQKSPWGQIYRRFVQPRFPAPTELEDPRPPRFAQLVGLVITAVALILHFAGVPHALLVGATMALIAAALNAFTGFCLGCELYVLGQRFRLRNA